MLICSVRTQAKINFVKYSLKLVGAIIFISLKIVKKVVKDKTSREKKI